MSENSSELTIKTLERRQRYRPGISIVSFEKISHISIVDFKEVNSSWEA